MTCQAGPDGCLVLQGTLSMLVAGALLLAPASARAQSETFELANGDKVSGEIVEQSDARIVLEHPVFGRVEIPRAELKQPEPRSPGLFGTGFLEGWTRTFSLGFSGQQGNSETADVVVALDGDFEDASRRWTFDARYNFSASQGSTTQNNAMTALGRDWLFADSRWFTFARGRFDYDDFRTWEFRLQGDGGVGYAFVRRETFELRARTGPSVAQEWDQDQFRAEWLAGPELVWRLTDTQRVEASNYFYYAFTPSAQYRNVSSFRWRWNLTQDPALNLEAGAENEYQSDVAPGSKRNDLRYWTAVGLDF